MSIVIGASLLTCSASFLDSSQNCLSVTLAKREEPDFSSTRRSGIAVGRANATMPATARPAPEANNSPATIARRIPAFLIVSPLPAFLAGERRVPQWGRKHMSFMKCPANDSNVRISDRGSSATTAGIGWKAAVPLLRSACGRFIHPDHRCERDPNVSDDGVCGSHASSGINLPGNVRRFLPTRHCADSAVASWLRTRGRNVGHDASFHGDLGSNRLRRRRGTYRHGHCNIQLD